MQSDRSSVTLLRRFVEMWTHPDYPPAPVSLEELSAAEHRLSIGFPDEYRTAILSIGLPRPSINLLDAIVERELHIHDVSNFFDPAEIVDETQAWRELGLPSTFVAFASDCSGNKFAFDAVKSGSAVLFWDHDFGRVSQLSKTFSDWLATFAEVEPWIE